MKNGKIDSLDLKFSRLCSLTIVLNLFGPFKNSPAITSQDAWGLVGRSAIHRFRRYIRYALYNATSSIPSIFKQNSTMRFPSSSHLRFPMISPSEPIISHDLGSFHGFPTFTRPFPMVNPPWVSRSPTRWALRTQTKVPGSSGDPTGWGLGKFLRGFGDRNMCLFPGKSRFFYRVSWFFVYLERTEETSFMGIICIQYIYIYLFIFIYSFIYLFIHLFIYLFIYLCI